MSCGIGDRGREYGGKIMLDRGHWVIILGTISVVVILAFFGYKQYDCGQHLARYNFYAGELNKANKGFVSSIASALIGHTQYLDETLHYEGLYINQNCAIIGMNTTEKA